MGYYNKTMGITNSASYFTLLQFMMIILLFNTWLLFLFSNLAQTTCRTECMFVTYLAVTNHSLIFQVTSRGWIIDETETPNISYID